MGFQQDQMEGGGADDNAPDCRRRHSYCCPGGSQPEQLLDSEGKACRLRLLSTAAPHMRSFHLAWATHFMAVFATFTAAPLLPVIRGNLDLTKTQVSAAGIAAVSGTIVSRVLTGGVCDRWGPRAAAATIQLLTASASFGMAVVGDGTGYITARLFIGFSPASFVPVLVLGDVQCQDCGHCQRGGRGLGQLGGGCRAAGHASLAGGAVQVPARLCRLALLLLDRRLDAGLGRHRGAGVGPGPACGKLRRAAGAGRHAAGQLGARVLVGGSQLPHLGHGPRLWLLIRDGAHDEQCAGPVPVRHIQHQPDRGGSAGVCVWLRQPVLAARGRHPVRPGGPQVWHARPPLGALPAAELRSRLLLRPVPDGGLPGRQHGHGGMHGADGDGGGRRHVWHHSLHLQKRLGSRKWHRRFRQQRRLHPAAGLVLHWQPNQLEPGLPLHGHHGSWHDHAPVPHSLSHVGRHAALQPGAWP